MTIYDEAMQMKEELVACRRDLHAHPELAWTEFRTASHVAKSLKALGYEVLMGDACMKADEMMGQQGAPSGFHPICNAYFRGAGYGTFP